MNRSKSLIVLAIVALCLPLVVSTAVADSSARGVTTVRPNPAVVEAGVASGERATNFIQYDNDTPFNRDGQDGGLIGNRFMPALAPHSISMVSFRMANVYPAAGPATANVGVWDNAGAGGGLLGTVAVAGITPPGNATVTTHTAPFTLTNHSGSFLAGIFQTGYDPCAGLTALNSGLACVGVALTQGTGVTEFHGVRITAWGASPTFSAQGVADIAGVNAIFRASGNNLPVELMSFDVE